MTDFTKINGIGKKTSDALYRAGVEGFSQLAALSPAEIEDLLIAQNVRVLGDVDSWIEQARALIPYEVDYQRLETAEGDTWVTVNFTDEQPNWTLDLGGPEFDDSLAALQSTTADNALVIVFTEDETERLQTLRDTMTRYFGPHITVTSMIRRMINERLIQHGYEKLGL